MIQLLNVKPGDIFNHEICYLYGECKDFIKPTIEVSSNCLEPISWSIRNSHFKAFVRLNFGKNEVTLKTDSCTAKITFYRLSQDFLKSEQSSYKRVRVLYIICNDDKTNGEFQSPNSSTNKLNNALRIISLNVKLLQTLMSEMIFRKYHTRKTFALEDDFLIKQNDKISNDDLVCMPFYSRLSLNKALNMTSNELFLHFADEIKSSLDIFELECKYIAILSFTRFCPSQHGDMYDNTRGFCALGAEWLAVYGTPCLFTWAGDLDELENCFNNSNLIDSDRFMNDSAFRNTYWGCYSTTLGSLLHEFSHVLDIGHNLNGIMSRGFDDLYRFFTFSSESCDCYTDMNLATDNLFIQKTMRFTSETQNSHTKFKEIRVQMLAIPKNNINETISLLNESLRILLGIDSSNKPFLVYNLTFTESIYSFIFEISNISHKIAETECKCMKSCFYTSSNLSILFYHRWIYGLDKGLNSKILNENNNNIQEEDNLIQVMVQHTLSNIQFKICSLNNLIQYELRTVKNSFTIDYNEFSSLPQISQDKSPQKKFKYFYEINYDMIKLKNKYVETYQQSEKSINSHLIDKTMHSNSNSIAIELFILDKLGNIFRKKYFI